MDTTPGITPGFGCSTCGMHVPHWSVRHFDVTRDRKLKAVYCADCAEQTDRCGSGRALDECDACYGITARRRGEDLPAPFNPHALADAIVEAFLS